MYWKYNTPSSVQIETLLQKEDVTLQELMEEEELLQECKAQNKKVVEFLTKPETLEALVYMVVEEPSSDKDLQVQFKPANLASELLTCDVPAIIDNLASSNLLLILYRFLEKEKPLNPLMASFVSKVFGMLIVRRTEQNWYRYQWICFQVLEFFQSQGNFVELAVRHIGTSAILDLLSKLICGVDNDDQAIKNRIHNWLNECELIEKLLHKLTPDCDSEEHSSVDQLLSELIRSCRESPSNGKESQQNGCKSSLLATLESEMIVNKLLDILLLENRNQSSVSHVINILLTLLSNRSPNHQAHFQHILSIDLISNVIDNRTVITTILQRLPEIQQILVLPSKLCPVFTSYGKEVERLGSMRLQITNLIACLISTNDLMVHTKLAELSTLQVLLDLFFRFSLNNFLHTQVTQCIVCVIKNSLTSCDDARLSPPITDGTCKQDAQIDGLNNNSLKSDPGFQPAVEAEPCPKVETMQVQDSVESVPQIDSQNKLEATCMESNNADQQMPSFSLEEFGSHPLLIQLFECCKIIEILLQKFCPEDNPEIVEKNIHNVCGYMGHLREIANAIVDVIDTQGPNFSLISRLVQRLPENIQTDWEDFKLITLAEINLKNKVIPIQNPHHSIDDSVDDIWTKDLESIVITNQGFRDSEIDVISDFRSGAAFDDFKDTMENIRQMNLGASEAGGTQTISHDLDFDTDNSGMENLELFQEMCAQRSLSSDEFDDMWKFEKEITFAPAASKLDTSDDNGDSSPEEDPDIDNEFDLLRTPSKEDQQQHPEDMDVDDIGEDEWSEVFDKRGSSGSIEPFNPWQGAPAADTSQDNNWASFASSPLSMKSDKFVSFGEKQSQNDPRGSFEAFSLSDADQQDNQQPQNFFAAFPSDPAPALNQQSCDVERDVSDATEHKKNIEGLNTLNSFEPEKKEDAESEIQEQEPQKLENMQCSEDTAIEKQDQAKEEADKGKETPLPSSES